MKGGNIMNNNTKGKNTINSEVENSGKKRLSSKTVAFISILVMLAPVAALGWASEAGMAAVNLRLEKNDKSYDGQTGCYQMYVQSTAVVPMAAVIEDTRSDSIMFSMMTNGSGEFFTNAKDNKALSPFGYTKNAYAVNNSNLSEVTIHTSYTDYEDSTICHVESVDIATKKNDCGILVYKIHNTSSFATINNAYNIITNEGRRCVLDSDSFIVDKGTRCDDKLYVEPVCFIKAEKITPSTYTKTPAWSSYPAENTAIHSCDIKFNSRDYKMGFCIFIAELDNSSELGIARVEDCKAVLDSSIGFDGSRLLLGDETVEFTVKYFIPIHKPF